MQITMPAYIFNKSEIEVNIYNISEKYVKNKMSDFELVTATCFDLWCLYFLCLEVRSSKVIKLLYTAKPLEA